MPPRRDLAQRVRIQLGVDRLDEEGGTQATCVELAEQPGQRPRHRRIVPDRRARRRLASLQRPSLAKVVNRQDERAW